MGKQIEKLSALAVSKAKKKGYYADGNNLYLQVVDSGAKTWIFRYMLNGKSREMGLGAAHAISLAEAREKPEPKECYWDDSRTAQILLNILYK